MSGDKQGAKNKSAADKEEAELVASLERLNSAHNQLVAARQTIMAMLRPLHASAADPELVYAAFAASAQKAMADLKEFQSAIRDGKMQELLQKGKMAVKQEDGAGGVDGWLGNLNNGLSNDWIVEEEAGSAINGLDALKIERQDTPKKT